MATNNAIGLKDQGTAYVNASGAFVGLDGSTAGFVLTSNGTTVAPSFQAATGSTGLLSASGVLTSAQIKSLNASPVTAIAAPGAGKIIQVDSGIATLNYGGTNPFTTTATQSIILAYAGVVITSAGVLSNANVIASVSQMAVFGGSGGGALASASNRAIVLYNDISPEIAGNAANNNTVSWTIFYRIVTIP